jgi:spermidine/putrescine transport system substrate-binding protein
MIFAQKMILLIFLTAYSYTVFAETTTLKICEWEGYIMPWESQFQAYAKERGMDVELKLHPKYLSSPEQVFNLTRGNFCDVITPTHSYFSQRKNQLFRLLLPIDFSKIPNYSNVSPAVKKLKYNSYMGEHYAIPLLAGSYGLAYNADKVQEPTSFDVLFDLKNKCKITITKEQIATNFYIVLSKSGYDQASIYDMDKVITSSGFEDPKIQKNLELLYSNVCSQERFWLGEADFSKSDLLYGTTYWFGVATVKKKGMNWKIAHNVRSTVWLDTLSFVSTLKDSPNKLKAAYLLADFMLSTSTQEKIHKKYGVVVVNTNVKQELDDLSLFFTDAWLWKPLTTRTQGIYRIMHNKALNTLQETKSDTSFSSKGIINSMN